MEELRNVAEHEPLWPGDAISHATLHECERRGWARRSYVGGRVVLTEVGRAVANMERASTDG